MGTITGQQITTDSWRVLQDDRGAGGTRWTAAEMLSWLNAALRATVVALPRANTARTVAAPVAGTRQTLAGMGITGGLVVLEVARNFAADGTTPGSAITLINRGELNHELPSWHSDTDTEAYHYMLDPDEPDAFWLWPGLTGTGKIEVLHSALPTPMTDLANAIPIHDQFATALHHYQLFKAYSKRVQNNADSTGMAGAYLQMWQQDLGLSGQSAEAAAQRARAENLGA